ncbi:hypothetical protein V8F20_006285 [Naviculisporaceae sp. PSN 640]
MQIIEIRASNCDETTTPHILLFSISPLVMIVVLVKPVFPCFLYFIGTHCHRIWRIGQAHRDHHRHLLGALRIVLFSVSLTPFSTIFVLLPKWNHFWSSSFQQKEKDKIGIDPHRSLFRLHPTIHKLRWSPFVACQFDTCQKCCTSSSPLRGALEQTSPNNTVCVFFLALFLLGLLFTSGLTSNEEYAVFDGLRDPLIPLMFTRFRCPPPTTKLLFDHTVIHHVSPRPIGTWFRN